MRDDIDEKAYALCLALAVDFDFSGMNCWETIYSGPGLVPSAQTCLTDSFASYRYSAFPDALESLTAFAEAYVPDWYVKEISEKNDAGEWVPVGEAVNADYAGDALTILRRRLVDMNGDTVLTPEDAIDILKIYSANLA